MSSPFDNMNFAQYKPTYVGLPVEEFVNSAQVLNQRYEENIQAKDKLDILLSTLEVDEPNKPHLKNRINAVRTELESTVKSGAYEDAAPVLQKVYTEFAKDKALRTSLDHHARNRQTEQQLFTAYASNDKNKMLDQEQYQDRIKKLKQYSGIGDPVDDMGNYQPFQNTFENLLGAKYVDMDEKVQTYLQGYEGGDVMSHTNSSLGYSAIPSAGLSADHAKMFGSPDSRSTTQMQAIDGTEAAGIVRSGIMNDPEAMAYLQDKLRIRKENNPNDPTTLDSLIGYYVDQTLAKEGKRTVSTSFEEMPVDISRLLAAQKTAKTKGKGDEESTLPAASIPFHVPITRTDADNSLNQVLGSNTNRGWRNIWSTIKEAALSTFNPGIAMEAKIKRLGPKPKGMSDNEYMMRALSIENMAPWQNRSEYVKYNYNMLDDQDKELAINQLRLFGTPDLIMQLDQHNNDLTKLDDVVLEDYLKSPEFKDNANRVQYTSNTFRTAATRPSVEAATLLFKDRTLKEIGENSLIRMLPVYNMTTGKYYRSYDELLKEGGSANDKWNPLSSVDKEIASAKIGSVSESLLTNGLYSETGDMRMTTGLSVQIGANTLVFGIGPKMSADGTLQAGIEIDRNKYPNAMQEYYTNSYLNLNYNRLISKANRMPINEQIQRGISPTELTNPFDSNQAKIKAYTTAVESLGHQGTVVTHMFRLINPETGNVMESSIYEDAVFGLAEKDAAKDPNRYYTFSQIQSE